MALNEIRELFAASTAFTITLNALADDAGRQSTMIDNETSRDADALIFVAIDIASGGVADAIIEIYALRADQTTSPNISTDGAGASDAALTVLNAKLIGTLRVNASGGVQDLEGEFLFARPGRNFGIAIVNKSGAALDSTTNAARYVLIKPEIE